MVAASYKKYLTMKNKFFIAVVACACLGTLTSCESWLDEEVRSSLTAPDYYKTSLQIQENATSLYRRGAPNQLTGAGSAYMGPISTLPGMLTGYFRNEYDGQERTCAYARELTRQEQTNTVSGSFENFYYSCYQAINISNGILSSADNVDMTTDARNTAKGEAYFFRAFNYFTLVKYFGGVPLLITPTSDDPTTYQVAKSDASAIYAQIESDLKEAVNLLPAKKFYENGNRVGKYAAAMLLTSVYMQEGKYSEAATSVKTVLNSGHKLTENINTTDQSAYNQLRSTDGLDEVIYAYEYNATISTSGWWPSYAFSGADGLLSTYSICRRIYGPSSRFLNIYDANDLRVQPNQFFHWQFSYTNKKGEVKSWSDTEPGCWYFYDEEACMTTGQGTKDQNFFRYSEALLDAAEAIVQSGGAVTDEAAGYLAQVQVRANGKTLDATKTALKALSKDDFIHTCWTERLREFPLEFKIWDDCLRTKMFPNVSADTKGKVDYEKLIGATNGAGATFKQTDLVWPFPLNELQRNGKLVQNEGYAKE